MLEWIALNPPSSGRRRKNPPKRGRRRRRNMPPRGKGGRFKKRNPAYGLGGAAFTAARLRGMREGGEVPKAKKGWGGAGKGKKRKRPPRAKHRAPKRRASSVRKKKKGTVAKRSHASYVAAGKKGSRTRKRRKSERKAARKSGGKRKAARRPKRKGGGRRRGRRAKKVYRRARSGKRKGQFVSTGRGPVYRRRRGGKGMRRLNRGGGGIVAQVTRALRSVTQPKSYVDAAQMLLGLGASLALPVVITRQLGRPDFNRGYLSIVASALSTALAAGVVSMLPFRGAAGLAANILAGGIMGTTAKLAVAVLPAETLQMFLPLEQLRVAAQPVRALPGPRTGAAGLGIMTEDQLIAENMGDFLNSSSFRGMGDYMSSQGLPEFSDNYGENVY